MQAMINQRELDIIGSRMSQDAFEPTIARMEKGEYITEGNNIHQIQRD